MTEIDELLADLLCLGGEYAVDTEALDVKGELDQAARRADSDPEPIADRNRRLIEAARRRIHQSSVRHQAAIHRVVDFMELVPADVAEQVRAHVDYDERVLRALGGVARALEAPLTRSQRRESMRLRFEPSANDLLAYWIPDGQRIPLRNVVGLKFEQLAEFDEDLSDRLASVVLKAAFESKDVLPGYAVESGHAPDGPAYVRLPNVLSVPAPQSPEVSETTSVHGEVQDGAEPLAGVEEVRDVVNAVRVDGALIQLGRPAAHGFVMSRREWNPDASAALVANLAEVTRRSSEEVQRDLSRLIKMRIEAATRVAAMRVTTMLVSHLSLFLTR